MNGFWITKITSFRFRHSELLQAGMTDRLGGLKFTLSKNIWHRCIPRSFEFDDDGDNDVNIALG